MKQHYNIIELLPSLTAERQAVAEARDELTKLVESFDFVMDHITNTARQRRQEAEAQEQESAPVKTPRVSWNNMIVDAIMLGASKPREMWEHIKLHNPNASRDVFYQALTRAVDGGFIFKRGTSYLLTKKGKALTHAKPSKKAKTVPAPNGAASEEAAFVLN